MEVKANIKMLEKTMFRLLPIQVLLAVIGSVNGLVSSLFASNYVGISAMSAVALYAPLNMLITAVSVTLVGGASIVCGMYMGRGERKKMQSIFSLDLVLAALVALVFTILLLAMGVFGLTGFLTQDSQVRPLLNMYLIGQSIGVLPLSLGSQLSAFLSLENRIRRTTAASLVYIAVNIVLNFLFVQVLRMQAFGLALASSLGMWVFFAVQAQYFMTRHAQLRFSIHELSWKDSVDIIKIGYPGALSNGYQTIRGLLVNTLLDTFIGSAALSAFGACNNLMSIFWALPTGMLSVSRLLIGVSAGEEDRQTMTDVFRVMFRRYIPLMCVVCAGIILCGRIFTGFYYHDPGEPVFMMTVWGFRILPLCMPLSIICMHFVCYGETFGRHVFVHILSALDGVIGVALFTALLIRPVGMNSVYIANVLNGVITTLFIIGYAAAKKGHFPKNMADLLVLPENFGVPESARMDLSIRSVEEVVTVAQNVQTFCASRGIDPRRAYLAGLSMEEMAGNIVEHGFTKDHKKHSVDIRVVYKEDEIILRLRDDCRAFDPGKRLEIADPNDPTRHIGLRMVFAMASQVRYQSILGMNVLSIRI